MDLPIEHGGSFHGYVSHYQRVCPKFQRSLPKLVSLMTATARSSPQMSSWWWSSQTKLGRRMPGITCLDGMIVSIVSWCPHQISGSCPGQTPSNWLIFCLCHLLLLAARLTCQADICCQGECARRVPVPQPGKLAAATRLSMKIGPKKHVQYVVWSILGGWST